MTGTPPDAETAPEVRDLDAAAVLDAVVATRPAADAEEARLLALAGRDAHCSPGGQMVE
jgi:hypothetical protein